MITILQRSKQSTGFKRAGIWKVLGFLMLNLLVGVSVQAQTAIIPAGNPANTPQPNSVIKSYPFGNSYPYQKSGAIYLGSEVATTGSVAAGSIITITHISYYLEYTNGAQPSTVRITLDATAATDFPNPVTYQSILSGTQVFSGTVAVPNTPQGGTGTWVTVNITDYSFNTSSNLKVLVESDCISCAGIPNDTGDETLLDAKQFRYHDVGTTRFIYFRSSSSATSVVGETTNFRPNIQLTFTTSTTPVCEAPTGLNATNVTSNSADLNFTQSATGATGTYTVEYGPTGFTPGSGTSITGVTASTVNVTGLSPSTTYQFYVTKNCSGGNSTTAGPASFTTLAAPPLTCDAPTGLSATNITSNSASLNFTPSSTGATGTYTVEYGISGFTLGSGTQVTGVSSSPVNITGLTPSTGYQFYVTKNCSGGNSTTAGPASFTTAAATATCDAPTNLNATNVTQTTATLNFTVASAGDTYTAEYGPTGYTPGTGTSVPGFVSSSPINVTGLTAGTAYDFYITRQCQNSFSTAGPGSFTTQPATTTCDDPTNLSATNITQTSADLNFTLNGTGGSYTIEFAQGSQGFAQGTGTTITGLATSPYNLANLDPGTTYQFYVTKNCSGNNSNRVGPVVFTTQSAPTPTCAAPTIVSGNGFRNGTAQLTFSGGDPGMQELQYSTDATFNTGIVSVNPASSPTNLSGLAPGTYSFRVRTTCTNNVVSNFSPVDTFIIAQPATPTCNQVVVNSITPGQNALTFNYTAGSAGTHTITLTASGAPTVTTTLGASPATVSGLLDNTVYNYSIVTNCTAGGTATTTGVAPATNPAPTPSCNQVAVNGTTAGTTTVVFDYTAGSAGTHTITLTDPTGNAPTVISTLGTSPATVSGLQSGVTYNYSIVTACTAGGNSVATTGQVTTLSTPCVAGTWLGTTSSDWHTPANWCNGVIPDGTTDVIIPASTSSVPVPNYPVISANAFTDDLTIAAGATLTLSGGLLTINGLFTNLGTLIDNGNGSLAFTSTTPQTLGKPGNVLTFLDLTIGPGGAVQAGPVRVRKVLTLNGNLTTAGNELTLLADNAIQSMVVNIGSADVVGDATFQKYINPGNNPSFGYRHLTSPVMNKTLAELSDDTNLVFNPAYNSNPATANPFPTIFRYEELRLNAVPTPTFDTGWESPTGPGETMEQAEGFTVNMLPNQVDFTGELNNGNVQRTLTRASTANANGWNFIGNPYPSPIDWTLVNKTNVINAAAYVFQSTSQYGGRYISFVNGVPAGAQLIPAVQGFFVRAVANGALLTFENNDRVTTYENPALYKQAETRPLVELTLKNSAGHLDKTYVYFENGATANFDGNFDAFKLPSSGPSPAIYSLAGADKLSINGLPVSTATTVIPLGGKVPQAGTWTFEADQIINFLPGQVIYLEDLTTGLVHNLSQQNSYSFSTTQTDLTGRFFLRFGPATTTGIAGIDLAAKVLVYPNPNNGQFTISMPTFNSPSVTAELYNAVGQKVWKKTMTATGMHLKETVNTRDLPYGVYTLRLETAAGPVQRKIVIE